ncbi:hypothetical protein F8M41_014121 [Gigaspora margarita]|uniref:Uncharacterized protein n=1 Tax=Gigaspora margarita TaxID=4874 RepID=A0A8H3WVT3_GIGMA|nr:hypothetical protein F8M41_014121 [Gigaspora margarita]
MNEMIESEYLESAEGSNYWSYLKSAKNTWLYLKSAGDSNSCGQNNLGLYLNLAESGDSASQNNNGLWPAQQLYQALYYLQNSHPFYNQNFIYTTQINYLSMITLLNSFN